MVDINGKKIFENTILEDDDGRKYRVVSNDNNLFIQSLFYDSGNGKYDLYQERINRNKFKIIEEGVQFYGKRNKRFM